MRQPTRDEINRELARRSLAHFIRQAWHVVEPDTELLWNWHIDAIAEHLEAVSDGRIRRLLINVPPGHMKSLIVCVFWPAWMWLHQPGWRALFGSYSADLAIRDSVRCRDLLQNEWYQDTFHPGWHFAGDQNVKSYFKNDRQGFRFSLSVGSQATGWRGHCVVVDDPLNVKNQWSEIARAEAIRWWDKTMSSRLNDPRSGSRVIIMQRLHEEDLSGHVLTKTKGQYVHLCLPSEFEPESQCVTELGWSDPRSKEGELLFPSLFNREVLDEAKEDLGSTDYAGQHQQKPAPAEGIVIKRAWINYYQRAPLQFDRIIQSWDCAFKDLKTSSYVAGTVWGQVGADCYLLDRIHEHLDLPGTMRAVESMTQKHPLAVGKLVEDKANGPAVVQMLAKRVPGLISVSPEGGKMARAYAVQPLFEAGNVHLPAPAIAPWVEEYVHNITSFPGARTDDDMDSTSQALHHLDVRRNPTVYTSAGRPRSMR